MLVVVGCVVVVRACELAVVWAVALWAAGEYRGIGDGGSCRGRSVVRGRWRGSGSGRFRVVVGAVFLVEGLVEMRWYSGSGGGVGSGVTRGRRGGRGRCMVR